MRVLSPILRQVIYPALGSTGYFRAAKSGAPAVLTYHGVVPDWYEMDDDIPDGPLLKATNFRNQLRFLKKHYSVISPKQFHDWLTHKAALPPRAVLLTCDDGLQNHRTEMLPILREEEVACLFFVTATSVNDSSAMLWYVELYLVLAQSRKSSCRFQIGKTAWDGPLGNSSQRRATWVELVNQLSRYDARHRTAWLRQALVELEVDAASGLLLTDMTARMRFALMTKADLQELTESGMSIGAHTVSHPLLSKQNSVLAEYEIGESRRVLEDALGVPIWCMAYPFGHSGSATQREFDLAKSAGYECAFRNVGGPVAAGSQLFALPRIHVTPEMRLSELEAHVSGFHWKLSQSVRPA
jgi:peptidoglycan/xylan/chitin deacetylase (PgdA/CDA1 family)